MEVLVRASEALDLSTPSQKVTLMSQENNGIPCANRKRLQKHPFLLFTHQEQGS